MDRKTLMCAAVALLVTLAGCGNSLNCLVYGDNVKGRVNFSSVVAPEAGTHIVVQVSANDFTTVDTSYVSNQQGFLSVPYSACADYGTIKARAFQDSDHNNAYDVGEGAGRYDGDATGHVAHATFSLPAPDPDAIDSEQEWPTKENVDISLDDVAGL